MFKKERRFGALRAVLTPQVRIAIVVVIILVILCYALPVNTYLQNLMAWIDSLNIVLGAILFMTFYAFIVVSFLPSMVLSLAAGYLWGFGHALLVVVTGIHFSKKKNHFHNVCKKFTHCIQRLYDWFCFGFSFGKKSLLQ